MSDFVGTRSCVSDALSIQTVDSVMQFCACDRLRTYGKMNFMQTYLGELRIKAVPENLRTISYFVQGIADRLKLSEQVQFELELAVEEASTNIIHHAYHDDNRGDIQLNAELIGNTIRL